MNAFLLKLKASIALCLFLGFMPNSFSQNQNKKGNTNQQPISQEDAISSHFDIISRIPQEKLYLQLDKPYYGAGESIWFKGYLVNQFLI